MLVQGLVSRTVSDLVDPFRERVESKCFIDSCLEAEKLLRDGAQRTAESLWQLCGEVLDLFTPQECSSCFRHCGYCYS